MSVGVSLFMMVDYIFHNRREIPALIVKARKPTAMRTHTFDMPEPLPAGPIAGHGRPRVRPSRRRKKIVPS